jgi:hypothetical protein
MPSAVLYSNYYAILKVLYQQALNLDFSEINIDLPEHMISILLPSSDNMGLQVCFISIG